MNIKQTNMNKLDLEDIEKVFPGFLKEAHSFLRDYKVPDGKPQNCKRKKERKNTQT